MHLESNEDGLTATSSQLINLATGHLNVSQDLASNVLTQATDLMVDIGDGDELLDNAGLSPGRE